MKKHLFFTICMLGSQLLAQGDATALQPNITREDRWLEYEERRLTDLTFREKITEFFQEIKESFAHSLLIDILFFKNNRVETEFCRDILAKFDLDPSEVTILSKPLDFTPALTIFNTVVIDHDKMSKLTAEEQAFILGHELVHLKNKDWATRMLLALLIELTNVYGTRALANMLPITGDTARAVADTQAVFALIFWAIGELCIAIPLMQRFSRFQEKRCDMVSARTLGVARAGASAFEKIRRKWISRQEAPLNPNGIWYNWNTWFGLLLSHPELFDRSAYLLALAEEEEATE